MAAGTDGASAVALRCDRLATAFFERLAHLIRGCRRMPPSCGGIASSHRVASAEPAEASCAFPACLGAGEPDELSSETAPGPLPPPFPDARALPGLPRVQGARGDGAEPWRGRPSASVLSSCGTSLLPSALRIRRRDSRPAAPPPVAEHPLGRLPAATPGGAGWGLPVPAAWLRQIRDPPSSPRRHGRTAWSAPQARRPQEFREGPGMPCRGARRLTRAGACPARNAGTPPRSGSFSALPCMTPRGERRSRTSGWQRRPRGRLPVRGRTCGSGVPSREACSFSWLGHPPYCRRPGAPRPVPVAVGWPPGTGRRAWTAPPRRERLPAGAGLRPVRRAELSFPSPAPWNSATREARHGPCQQARWRTLR